jgi:hypothetical protein
VGQASISRSKIRSLFRRRQIEESLDPTPIRWTWACRFLRHETYEINEDTNDPPTPGDLALFRVTRIGSHVRLINTLNQKLRIYTGDLFVGVFGNRYATDALEAVVEGVRNLSLLTTAGMVGTVKSKHRSIKRTTQVDFLGYLKSSTQHNRINSKKIQYKRARARSGIKNIIAVIGSGMNSGKTTFCRKLIKSLSEKGLKVTACKLTGSISPRDYDEMLSASAVFVTDFSDYGFPSTYRCDKEELMNLFETMLADLEKLNPDIIIMEVADGVLQRETNMILDEPLFKKLVSGIIVTADSAPSALYTVGYLEQKGFRIIGVSGAVTSSPLYVKEFVDYHTAPIISSAASILNVLPVFEDFLNSDRITK